MTTYRLGEPYVFCIARTRLVAVQLESQISNIMTVFGTFLRNSLCAGDFSRSVYAVVVKPGTRFLRRRVARVASKPRGTYQCRARDQLFARSASTSAR